MKISVCKLIDYKIQAHDGEIGSLKDVLFDEHVWTVRYLVADTGGWLFGRNVLLSPFCAKAPLVSERFLPVDLTREQVKNSPDLASDPPIDKARVVEYHDYFRWPYYWGGGGTLGGTGIGVEPAAIDLGNTHVIATDGTVLPEEPLDLHLRSAKEIIGYKTRDDDRVTGEVIDLIVDVSDWKVPFLVLKLDVGMGDDDKRQVLIPTGLVQRLGPPDKYIDLDVPLARLLEAPAFDEALEADAAYLDVVSHYYQRAA